MFEDIGLLFFTVLILSVLLTPFSVAVSYRLGAVDHPVDRSVHLKPMPRLGGLGMVLSILIGMALFLEFNPTVLAFIAGFSVIVMTGLADDVYQIKPILKMAGQLLACTIFIVLSGLTLTSLGDLFGMGELTFSSPWPYLVTLFCMVGVINAFNMSDGLDGLAAGMVAIICFFLGFLALKVHAWGALTLIVTLFGAVLGFLKFNSHPAMLFMGDIGSLMLGYSMAAICVILGASSEAEAIAPISIAMIMAVPIIDTLWVMVRRLLQGKSPMSPDKTHLHHRLLALGFPHSVAVTILYIWVMAFGALALFVKNAPEQMQFFSAIVLAVSLYALLTVCEKRNVCVPVREKKVIDQEPSSNEAYLKFAGILGQSMKLFPYVIVSGLLLPLLIAESVPSSLTQLTLGLALFVSVAFPWREYQERRNIVYGLFYLCGFTILYTWNVSTFLTFDLQKYTLIFGAVLLGWSLLKVKYKRHREVFLTSSFELLLIFVSWFVPYIVLPAIELPEHVLHAAKLSCLGAVPLLIAMKLVIKSQPHRNRKMTLALIVMLCLVSIRSY